MHRIGNGRWHGVVGPVLGMACMIATLAGCESPANKPAVRKKKTTRAAAEATVGKSSRSSTGTVAGRSGDDSVTVNRNLSQGEHKPPPRRLPPGFGPAQQPTGPRTFTDLLTDDTPGGKTASESPAAVSIAPTEEGGQAELLIDDTKAAVAGIRRLSGQHLTLYTDVLPAPDVDDLTDAFDLAVPQWCRYFGIDPAKAGDWRLTGFIMQEKNRFAGAGMLPADLPPFPNGYQRGKYLWVYDQPDGYYRRHLLLHEGTHAFMNHFLGDMGPPWYAEGMAELLGTHRWQDGVLALGYVPQDKSETPGWGRIKIIKDEAAAGRGMMPAAILDYGPQAHRRNEPYGWCWGLAAFLDAHPRYQERFRQLRGLVRNADFTARFKQELAADWADLNEEWQLFVMNLEYGYDVGRAAIVRKSAQPLPSNGAAASIAADHGWQSTGIRLEAGGKYRLAASGRYQVGKSSDIWWCEPGGVTLHYYQGRPLGLLLAAIRDDAQPVAGLTPLARPEPVGAASSLAAPTSGTLYLRINESAAKLSDNAGQIEVRVQRDES